MCLLYLFFFRRLRKLHLSQPRELFQFQIHSSSTWRVQILEVLDNIVIASDGEYNSEDDEDDIAEVNAGGCILITIAMVVVILKKILEY